MAICREADRRKKSRDVKQVEAVLAYLNENYGDAGLSLDAAADRIHMSKGYLSQFFREQTGVNFSEYLESLRLDAAKKWLSETDIFIRDIAERVGYHSSSTFCRAFKRDSGLSATAIREFAQREIGATAAQG